MKRVAIYARYSSNNQSEASIEDQVRLCKERADREGWQVVGTFSDPAVSGTIRDRPGLNMLLSLLGQIDIVLAEHTDRVSRDQEDLAAIFKNIRFAGVQWITLSQGEITQLHIGLGGTMSALFLHELGEKTKRGQIGRVAAGRIPGGISYGYRAVRQLRSDGEPERGLREIDEEQAGVIRRIFSEFLAGKSAVKIAHGLNEDGIPGPTGGIWRASAINGNRQRRNGVLHNELYAGRIVYNRQRFERDPSTRKRIARPNPPSEWKISEVEHLRIIDATTWSAAIALFDRAEGVKPERQKRPKRLFSGLAKCGSCGGTFTVVRLDRWGCSNFQQARSCQNNRTISTKDFEDRVLNALTVEMLSPEAVSAFVAEYHAAYETGQKEAGKRRRVLERRRAQLQRKINRFVDAIGEGAKRWGDIKHLVPPLTDERDRIVAELEDMDAEPAIAMHPRIADAYRASVQNLSEALNGPSEARDESRAMIRSLIDHLILMPPTDSSEPLEIDVQGRLAMILAAVNGKRPPQRTALSTVSVVAGTGFEPVTFRL